MEYSIDIYPDPQFATQKVINCDSILKKLIQNGDEILFVTQIIDQTENYTPHLERVAPEIQNEWQFCISLKKNGTFRTLYITSNILLFMWDFIYQTSNKIYK